MPPNALDSSSPPLRLSQRPYLFSLPFNQHAVGFDSAITPAGRPVSARVESGIIGHLETEVTAGRRCKLEIIFDKLISHCDVGEILHLRVLLLCEQPCSQRPDVPRGCSFLRGKFTRSRDVKLHTWTPSRQLHF